MDLNHWLNRGSRLLVTGLVGSLLATPVTVQAIEDPENTDPTEAADPIEDNDPADPTDPSVVQLDEIPTRLIIPTDPLYPDPVCLGCQLIAKRAQTSDDAAPTHGVITVTYDDDITPTFMGKLVVTVFLFNLNEHRTMTLDGILLNRGETAEYLMDPGLTWTWTDVESVWVEMVSTA